MKGPGKSYELFFAITTEFHYEPGLQWFPRKKLNLKGVKSDRCAILPEKKFPDQKKEEATSKKTAKTSFLDIYSSTKVIRDEVSKRLPPFFWTFS